MSKVKRKCVDIIEYFGCVDWLAENCRFLDKDGYCTRERDEKLKEIEK